MVNPVGNKKRHANQGASKSIHSQRQMFFEALVHMEGKAITMNITIVDRVG